MTEDAEDALALNLRKTSLTAEEMEFDPDYAELFDDEDLHVEIEEKDGQKVKEPVITVSKAREYFGRMQKRIEEAESKAAEEKRLLQEKADKAAAEKIALQEQLAVRPLPLAALSENLYATLKDGRRRCQAIGQNKLQCGKPVNVNKHPDYCRFHVPGSIYELDRKRRLEEHLVADKEIEKKKRIQASVFRKAKSKQEKEKLDALQAQLVAAEAEEKELMLSTSLSGNPKHRHAYRLNETVHS